MKNLFFLLTLSLAFMYSCTSDEANTVKLNQPSPKADGLSNMVHMINLNTGVVSSVSSEQLLTNSIDKVTPRGSSNQSTNGEFHIGSTYISFSGMQNNGGIHGTAYINHPFFEANLDTDCLSFDGNVAVYGGVITEVFYQNSFFCDHGLCLDPGVFMAFEVKDNGEGHNAPKDQVGNGFYWFDESLCQYLPPNSEAWGGFSDIIDGQIQVK